jgi:hypothetical protein
MSEQLSPLTEDKNVVKSPLTEIVNPWDSIIIQINSGDEGCGSIRMMKQDIVAITALHGSNRGEILDMMLSALETTPKKETNHKS